MRGYPEAAWERAMKVQEVILRAMAKRITWWQAAEILGMRERSLRRWRWRWQQYGYDGLFDRRRKRRKRRPLPGMLRGLLKHHAVVDVAVRPATVAVNREGNPLEKERQVGRLAAVFELLGRTGGKLLKNPGVVRPRRTGCGEHFVVRLPDVVAVEEPRLSHLRGNR